MTSIRIRRKLESETLHLAELKPLIGKNVEIIVREESTSLTTGVAGGADGAAKAVPSDLGCFAGLSMPSPPSEEETRELRGLLTAEQFEALIDVAGRGGPDVEAIARMRAKTRSAESPGATQPVPSLALQA